MDLNQIYTTILAAIPSIAAVGTVIGTAVKIKTSVDANKDSTVGAIKALTQNAEEQAKATTAENESLKNKINSLSADNANLRANIDELTVKISKVCDKMDTSGK